MKKFHLLTFAVAAFVLGGCQGKEDPSIDPTISDGEARYLSVSIATTSPTKADADDFEIGTTDENAVKKVRFYFFDEDGIAAAVKANGDSYFDYQPEATDGTTSSSANNVEKTFGATIVINTKLGDKLPSQMVAVVNPGSVAALSGNLRLSELQALVGRYDNQESTSNGFVMTSSVYAKNAAKQCAVAIAPENLKNSEDEAKGSPVLIYVERVLAKVRVQSKATTSSITYNGSTYDGAIDTKIEADMNGDGTAEKIYLLLEGWGLDNTANMTYLFKEINPSWSEENLFGTGNSWNSADNFRSYWATNPTAENPAPGNTATAFALQNSTYYGLTTTTIGTTKCLYCMENAADDKENGSKAYFDPDKALSNRTQVILKGTLVTDGATKAAPAPLAKWAGQYMTQDEAKAKMLAQVEGGIFKSDDNGGYKTIEASDVEFVSAYSLDNTIANTQNGKRYLSYLQLADAAANTQFYSDANGTTIKAEEVNDLLKSAVPGAQIWAKGQTYYYLDIQHLNETALTNTTDASYGQWGVVRNHLYDITISSIAGPGTPVFDDANESLIAQHTKDDDWYVAAQINILSWRLVSQSASITTE